MWGSMPLVVARILDYGPAQFIDTKRLRSNQHVYLASPTCLEHGHVGHYWDMLSTMPKLWNETIEAHRREVRDAILDTTAALVAEHGLRSVTMSQIAEKTGIGRATLYKYFPDVEAILPAWHERQITATSNISPSSGTRLATPASGSKRSSRPTRSSPTSPTGTDRTRGTPAPRRSRRPSAAAAQRFIRDLLTEGAETGDSGTMSRLTSSRATAFTPSRQPAACRPRPRSAGSSRSLWLGCAPRSD